MSNDTKLDIKYRNGYETKQLVSSIYIKLYF
jgi:hypothetical protein